MLDEGSAAVALGDVAVLDGGAGGGVISAGGVDGVDAETSAGALPVLGEVVEVTELRAGALRAGRALGGVALATFSDLGAGLAVAVSTGGLEVVLSVAAACEAPVSVAAGLAGALALSPFVAAVVGCVVFALVRVELLPGIL